MTNEEAKDALQLKKIQFSGETRRVVEFLEALCKAEEALDYRIAKTVEAEKLEKDLAMPGTHIIFRKGTNCLVRCPRCGHYMKMQDSFCAKCGQAIEVKES